MCGQMPCVVCYNNYGGCGIKGIVVCVWLAHALSCVLKFVPAIWWGEGRGGDHCVH